MWCFLGFKPYTAISLVEDDTISLRENRLCLSKMMKYYRVL